MKKKRRSSVRVYLNAGAIPFWGVHVAAIVGVVLVGFSWIGILWALSLYLTRMFFVTAGYHRYFAHRSFRASRPVQFVLGLLAQTSLQRGVLWWAATHRRHHRYSDAPEDVHSAQRDGFWWAHVGWMLAPDHDDVDRSLVRDLSRYPELRMLDRVRHLPGIALAAVLLWLAGPTALVWGFFVSTVLLWHGTFTINSLSHMFGSRRYDTTDSSRNNAALAILTLGEGWHNNHHHYQRSAAQGFFWWELDLTYYGLRVLEGLRLVSDVSRPPGHVLRGTTRADQRTRVAVGDSLGCDGVARCETAEGCDVRACDAGAQDGPVLHGVAPASASSSRLMAASSSISSPALKFWCR